MIRVITAYKTVRTDHYIGEYIMWFDTAFNKRKNLNYEAIPYGPLSSINIAIL